ncbi:MAG: hypothetical protein D6730_10340 [Bacteroidetes bacterium]|nr:MAG: hypothetical protein D6730_10340 [Bacteroidota bacterium]
MTALFATAVAVGVIRNRRFQLNQQAHEDLARELGMKLAFESPRAYRIFGRYRGYEALIAPVEMPPAVRESVPLATKASLSMTNPNRKRLYVFPQQTPLVALLPDDAAVKVTHPAQDWLEIRTDDLLFSSLILSEDVNISLGAFFQQHPRAILYLMDDELACILPGLIHKNVAVSTVIQAINLLCDLKDELN